jgi:hypothetical protein
MQRTNKALDNMQPGCSINRMGGSSHARPSVIAPYHVCKANERYNSVANEQQPRLPSQYRLHCYNGDDANRKMNSSNRSDSSPYHVSAFPSHAMQ